MKEFQVIIVGCDHTNTLGLIRSFGEAGIKPNLVIEADPKNNMCSHSKYADRIIYVKNLENVDGVLLKEFPEGGVIVTMSDIAAEHVDRKYDILKEKFIMPSFKNEGGHFKNNISKETQRLIADSVGVRTPKSWVIDWKGNPKELSDDIIYPCLIKAIDSEAGPKDLNIFHHKAELIEGLNNLSAQSSSSLFQIQEFIKKEKEIVFIGYAKGKDEIYIPAMIEKGVEYPEGFGWFLFGTLMPPDESIIKLSELKKLIAAFDYCGLFSIDFLWADGKAYMCEINFRNDGNGYYPTAAGINLPLMWYNSMVGRNNSEVFPALKRKYSIMREPISIIWAKEQGKWIPVLKEFLKSDMKEMWNWKDPKPFLRSMFRFIGIK